MSHTPEEMHLSTTEAGFIPSEWYDSAPETPYDPQFYAQDSQPNGNPASLDTTMNAHDGGASTGSDGTFPSPTSSNPPTALELAPHDTSIQRVIEDLFQTPGSATMEIPWGTCLLFNSPKAKLGSYICNLFKEGKSLCSTQFSRKDRFRHHLQRHLGIKPYACSDKVEKAKACDQTFASIAARDTHVANKNLEECTCGTAYLPKNRARHLAKRHTQA